MSDYTIELRFLETPPPVTSDVSKTLRRMRQFSKSPKCNSALVINFGNLEVAPEAAQKFASLDCDKALTRLKGL